MNNPSIYTPTVTIGSPDWNGISFDGCPFSSLPPWLCGAITAEKIRTVSQDTDYAVFDIDTADGIVRAVPGDRIKDEGNGVLSVWRQGPWAKVTPS